MCMHMHNAAAILNTFGQRRSSRVGSAIVFVITIPELRVHKPKVIYPTKPRAQTKVGDASTLYTAPRNAVMTNGRHFPFLTQHVLLITVFRPIFNIKVKIFGT